MKNFVLFGASGFVAPRHMKAIKDIGGDLIAAVDPHDSVGILDSYFPQCHFFTSFERFERFCYKTVQEGTQIDYVVVCSPNHLHDSHVRFALNLGADAICEKPLVLHEHNLDSLLDLEQKTNRRVWNVLQLRHHPLVAPIRDFIANESIVNGNIKYYTPRGFWYQSSWKADVSKSGGIATNIGVHLFDLALWLSGVENGEVRIQNDTSYFSKGILFTRKGDINFDLSILGGEQPTRLFELNDHSLELSKNFTDLHYEVYRNILDGNGFGIEDVRPAIRICEKIRYK